MISFHYCIALCVGYNKYYRRVHVRHYPWYIFYYILRRGNNFKILHWNTFCSKPRRNMLFRLVFSRKHTNVYMTLEYIHFAKCHCWKMLLVICIRSNYSSIFHINVVIKCICFIVTTWLQAVMCLYIFVVRLWI